MQRSLLSSLKVIAMMLATDNELHPKEKAWFMAITKNYGATFSERSQLEEYLSGKSPESLEEILSDVSGEFDKRRLLNFVRMAMRQDGIVRNAEIQLFYKIQKVFEKNLHDDFQELARSLLEHDKEVRAWKDLQRFGTAWSQHLPVFGLSGHYFSYDPRLWEALGNLLRAHKYKMMFLGAIYVAYLFLWS